jgi:hypothetical protein
MNLQAALFCPNRSWERRLVVIQGMECVVRTCTRCCRTEVVWSRRGVPPERRIGMTRRSGRVGFHYAEN